MTKKKIDYKAQGRASQKYFMDRIINPEHHAAVDARMKERADWIAQDNLARKAKWDAEHK